MGFDLLMRCNTDLSTVLGVGKPRRSYIGRDPDESRRSRNGMAFEGLGPVLVRFRTSVRARSLYHYLQGDGWPGCYQSQQCQCCYRLHRERGQRGLVHLLAECTAHSLGNRGVLPSLVLMAMAEAFSCPTVVNQIRAGIPDHPLCSSTVLRDRRWPIHLGSASRCPDLQVPKISLKYQKLCYKAAQLRLREAEWASPKRKKRS
jgi:hypothetical protein